MSRRPLTGLLAVLLLLVVGIVAYVASGDDAGLEGPRQVLPGMDGVAAAVVSGGSTELAAQDQRTQGADGEPRVALTEEEPSKGVSSIRRPRWDRPRDALWVTGQVVMPPGVPLDEQMVVEAEGSAFPSDPNGRRHHRVACGRCGGRRAARPGVSAA